MLTGEVFILQSCTFLKSFLLSKTSQHDEKTD